MTTVPRSQNHLAELLGISKGATSRQVARGMPNQSLEAAQAWRKKNIDPARIKGTRFDAHYKRGKQPTRDAQEGSLERAAALMDHAALELERGRSIDDVVPLLRKYMAAVPRHQRDLLGLHLAVMEVLVAHVLASLPARETNPRNDDGTPFYCDGAGMSDEDAQTAGEIWYEIAAGECCPESA